MDSGSRSVVLETPRILFYAVNGLGLGHVTRLLAIARAVRTLCPDAQILFITTSEADSVIYREGFAAIKIPSRSILPTAKIRGSVYTKLVQSVVMNAVAAFNPAILVADTFPAGATQELLPTLSWEMRRAFVFRAQKQERAADPFFQSALARYDLCICPHDEGEEQIVVPSNVKTVWSGPILIRSRDEALSREEARAKLGFADDERVAYITFGGGGDSEAKSSTAIAIDAVKRAGWTPAVADAPLTRDAANFDSAVRRIAHYPIAEMLNAFDCAISAAGYNTVAELMHFGVPSILLPFPRGLDDQHARVASLVTKGAAMTCDLNAQAIETALADLGDSAAGERLSRVAVAQIPRNGATLAAQSILGLL